MRNYALQDLSLAGVCWELDETTKKPATKREPVQQTLLETRNESKPIIIPPSAPITLDTIKSMVERPNDIDSLVRMIAEFNHPLRTGATNVVLPNIATKPNGLLIITDLPSSDDDISGKTVNTAFFFHLMFKISMYKTKVQK